MKPVDVFLLAGAGLALCGLLVLVHTGSPFDFYADPGPAARLRPESRDTTLLAGLPEVRSGALRGEWRPAPAGAPPAGEGPEASSAGGRWRRILVHQSGTASGDARSLATLRDAFGRPDLPYHFVIGNGKGLADGAIETGGRWRNQTAARQTSDAEVNATSIGICLVGDIRAGPPTKRQRAALGALVRSLQASCGIPSSAVGWHQGRDAGGGTCPGGWGPPAEVAKRRARLPH